MLTSRCCYVRSSLTVNSLHRQHGLRKRSLRFYRQRVAQPHKNHPNLIAHNRSQLNLSSLYGCSQVRQASSYVVASTSLRAISSQTTQRTTQFHLNCIQWNTAVRQAVWFFTVQVLWGTLELYYKPLQQRQYGSCAVLVWPDISSP